MTETELVAAAREGDRAAVRKLYDRYAPRVFAVVRRIAGNDELALDFAQEAWLRAIRALPTFRGEARFSTWLHRIAVNAALEAARKADLREKRESLAPEPFDSGAHSGDPLLARRLEAALNRLPRGMREVLVLHDVEEYTHEEIAGVLGITAGTSKSQLFKARGKMREILGQAREDGDPAGNSTLERRTTDEGEIRLEEAQARDLRRPGDWTYEGAEA
jgi:RNA polymerase sigma-70 factor (ECF subfamily)